MCVKVAKFGGTSLADAAQFKKVKAIIAMDSSRRFVVNSAPGKRDGTDIKVTDLLYECKKSVDIPSIFEECIAKVQSRFQDIIFELGINMDIKPYIEEIKTAILAGATNDYTVSRGEYLNGIILAQFLDYEFIDPSTMILFTADGQLDTEKTYDLVSSRLKDCKAAVIPGFYGSNTSGQVITFSRGGSDITGAIISRSLNANVYENWTDVSGILAADPRIVKSPSPISNISYKELRELTSMGASVLHEDAIYPVMEAGIPINIRNTNKPHDAGTMVEKQVSTLGNHLIPTGISGKKGFSLLSLVGKDVKSSNQFLQEVLKLSEQVNLNYKYILFGVDQLSLITESTVSIETTSEIKQQCLILGEELTITNDIALIAIVGEGIDKTNTLAKVSHAFLESSVEMLISILSLEQSTIIGVRNSDFEKSIELIYKACFNI